MSVASHKKHPTKFTNQNQRFYDDTTPHASVQDRYFCFVNSDYNFTYNISLLHSSPPFYHEEEGGGGSAVTSRINGTSTTYNPNTPAAP